MGGGRDGETLVEPNVASSKRAEGPLLLLVVLRAVLASSSSVVPRDRDWEKDAVSGASWSSGEVVGRSGMIFCSCSGLGGPACDTGVVRGCKSGSAKWGGRGGDLMGICDGWGFSPTAGSLARRLTGRWGLTGGLVEVSELGPAAFLEDTGTKGSCLDCDGNALLAPSLLFQGFAWEMPSQKGHLSEGLFHTGFGTARFVGARTGNLLAWTPVGREYGLALTRGILLGVVGCLRVDRGMELNDTAGGSDDARPLGNAGSWVSPHSSGITGCFCVSG